MESSALWYCENVQQPNSDVWVCWTLWKLRNVSFLKKSASKANVEINFWRQANTERTCLSVIAEYIRKIRGLLRSSVRSGQVFMLPAFFALLQYHQCGCWGCTSCDVRGGDWCILLPNPSRKNNSLKEQRFVSCSCCLNSFLIFFCCEYYHFQRSKYVNRPLEKKSRPCFKLWNYKFFEIISSVN